MIKEILQHLRAALVLVFLTVITGLVYPALVTGIAQVAFPFQADGSLVHRQGRVRGSALIGQPFCRPPLFLGPAFGNQPFAYNAAASSGSNLGPSNPELLAKLKERVVP